MYNKWGVPYNPPSSKKEKRLTEKEVLLLQTPISVQENSETVKNNKANEYARITQKV